MTSSNVERIKERLDIVDVIGSYVKLDKAGKSYKSKSPFTNERTPSFYVSPERQLFYCFSSGKGGDIFTFVQEIEGVDFKGSIKILAERAGIKLEFEDKKTQDAREKLFVLLDEAAHFFQDVLRKNSEAISYTEKRGISFKVADVWRLGYAPNDWREARSYLLKKGYTDGELSQVGLIKEAPGGKEPYDTFRDRIMFPIMDNSGRVVGFSGRILHPNDKAPKYLNSPDTILFKKSDILYGMHVAKTSIRRKDYAVLVEGQMDLIMSHQAGVSNTVASSGTAITDSHLKRLKQLSNRIIISFDSDSAGFKAANRTAQMALSMGMEVKVALMKEGKDPADIILESVDSWKTVLKNSKHIIDFYIDRLLAQGVSGRDLAKELSMHVLPYIAELQSDIEKSHFISRIVKETGFKEDAIWTDLKKIESRGAAPLKDDSVAEKKTKTKTETAQERLTSIYVWQKQTKESLISVEDLEKEIMRIGEAHLLSEFQNIVTDEINKSLFEIEAYYDKKEALEGDIKELLANLEFDILNKKQKSLSSDLQDEKEDAMQENNHILLRIRELQKKHKQLNFTKLEQQ